MSETDGIPERLIRLEGKLDAYAAGQSARLDAIDKRLDHQQTTLNLHQTAIDSLRSGTRSSMSGWQVAAVIVAGLVGVGTLLGVGISLVQAVAGAGA